LALPARRAEGRFLVFTAPTKPTGKGGSGSIRRVPNSLPEWQVVSQASRSAFDRNMVDSSRSSVRSPGVYVKQHRPMKVIAVDAHVRARPRAGARSHRGETLGAVNWPDERAGEIFIPEAPDD
jgi:hypothetical protein